MTGCIFRWRRYCATGNKYLSSSQNNGIKIQRRHHRRIDTTIHKATVILAQFYTGLYLFVRLQFSGNKRMLNGGKRTVNRLFRFILR